MLGKGGTVTNTPAYKAASVESFFGVNAINNFCYVFMVKTNKVSKNLQGRRLSVTPLGTPIQAY
jgi:hypothetical protein